MYNQKMIFSVAVITLLFFSCSNKNGNKSNVSIPSCLSQQIALLDKKQTTDPPVQIDEYMYNNKRVFLFTAGCCDQYNTVYDEQCNAICAPSGGLDGKGDHKCENFLKDAKLIKKIWPTDAKPAGQ